MIAGITGHQNLGTADRIEWTGAALRKEVTQCGATAGVSCLAIGADQLFAALILEQNLKLIAVIPSHTYETTFTNTTALLRYRQLKARAALLDQLEHQYPTETAFFDASTRVVQRCDLLLAVWDGKPARGFGGTADVVALALRMQKTVIHINLAVQKVVRL